MQFLERIENWVEKAFAIRMYFALRVHDRLSSNRRGMSPWARRYAEARVARHVLSWHEPLRYQALMLIDKLRIVTAAPALHRRAWALELQTGGLRELERVRRTIERLGPEAQLPRPPETKLETFRRLMVAHWQRVFEQTNLHEDAHVFSSRLASPYASLDDEERATADRILIEWLRVDTGYTLDVVVLCHVTAALPVLRQWELYYAQSLREFQAASLHHIGDVIETLADGEDESLIHTRLSGWFRWVALLYAMRRPVKAVWLLLFRAADPVGRLILRRHSDLLYAHFGGLYRWGGRRTRRFLETRVSECVLSTNALAHYRALLLIERYGLSCAVPALHARARRLDRSPSAGVLDALKRIRRCLLRIGAPLEPPAVEESEFECLQRDAATEWRCILSDSSISSTEKDRRRNALFSAHGSLGRDKAVRLMREWLRSPEPSVRYNVMAAIEDLWMTELADELRAHRNRLAQADEAWELREVNEVLKAIERIEALERS